MPTIHTPKKRHTVRPYRFRLSKDHPLGHGLVFAGLGNVAGSEHYDDSSVHENHGTLTNMNAATDWVIALSRRALYFPSMRSPQPYVGQIGDILSASGPWTVSCWVKSTGTGANYLWSQWISNDGHLLWQPTGSTDLQYTVDGSSQIRISSFFTTYNDWVHVALVRNGANSIIYANGVEVGSNGSTASATGGTKFIIGNRESPVDRQWLGNIADVMIFERAACSAELSELADPSNYMLSGLIEPLRQPPTYFFTEPPPSEAKTGIFESLIIGV